MATGSSKFGLHYRIQVVLRPALGRWQKEVLRKVSMQASEGIGSQRTRIFRQGITVSR